MMPITSPSNPHIKALAALRERKHRQESGLFWLEGAEVVMRALAAGWQPQQLVLAAPTVAVPSGVQGAEVLVATPALLGKITGKANPQPLLGVFCQRWQPLPLAPQGVVLVLDRPRDPGNLGSIFRTAEAAGVSDVVLVGNHTDPFAPECARASMGSLTAMRLSAGEEAAVVTWQQAAHLPVLGTHLAATADYRAAAAMPRPLALLLGNESEGLSPVLAAACTHRVRIPMHGAVESLNLAAAAALMLYALRVEHPTPA